MILENITNRKLLAFIVGIVVGLLLAGGVLAFAQDQFVGCLPGFLAYFGGILTAFVAANAAEDAAKAKYAQPITPVVNVNSTGQPPADQAQTSGGGV